MTMEEWVKMWEAISKGQSPKVPAQLHLDRQLNKIINAFGDEKAAYNYFKEVLYAEAPDKKKTDE